MTDVHCHVTGGDAEVREFLVGRDFIGLHPWEGVSLEALACLEPLEKLDSLDKLEPLDSLERALRGRLAADPQLGVGEIGLDRLKERTISPQMRELFETQLALAAEFRRPVVLHGAKCWGQVVETVKRFAIPSFLFHGFSRSDGLLPDIVALNGFISVGPAVLNDHAVNYRELVKKIPLDRLLVETDRTPENAATCPSVVRVAAKVAELRGLSLAELEQLTDENANRFRNGGLD